MYNVNEKHRFNKGDCVVVVDRGCVYSTYVSMAKALGAKFYREGNSAYHCNKCGIVMGMSNHLRDGYPVICLIRSIQDDKYHEFLIGEDGLELSSGQDRQKYFSEVRRCGLEGSYCHANHKSC